MVAKVTSKMKAECMGEFSFSITSECGECIDIGPDEDCDVCGGSIIYEQPITVPWDVCKEIYKRMSEVAGEG